MLLRRLAVLSIFVLSFMCLLFFKNHHQIIAKISIEKADCSIFAQLSSISGCHHLFSFSRAKYCPSPKIFLLLLICNPSPRAKYFPPQKINFSSFSTLSFPYMDHIFSSFSFSLTLFISRPSIILLSLCQIFHLIFSVQLLLSSLSRIRSFEIQYL